MLIHSNNYPNCEHFLVMFHTLLAKLDPCASDKILIQANKQNLESTASFLVASVFFVCIWILQCQSTFRIKYLRFQGCRGPFLFFTFDRLDRYMHTTGKLEGIVFKASLPITSGIFSCRHGGMAEYFLLSQGTCGGVGECHAAGSRDTSLVSHRALVAQSKIYCPTRSPRAIARSGGGRGKGGEDTWWINMTGGRTSKLGCVHVYIYICIVYTTL